MDFFDVYRLVWATGGIAVGILSILRLDMFIALSRDWSLFLYRKTGFPPFKYQAEAAGSVASRLVVVFAAIILIVVSIRTISDLV
jgi:hypothetical protein